MDVPLPNNGQTIHKMSQEEGLARARQAASVVCEATLVVREMALVEVRLDPAGVELVLLDLVV